MRLTNLTVDQAGILKNVRLQNLSDLNVILGGNGSGKSTLARFIFDLLLARNGLSADCSGQPATGRIELSHDGSAWVLDTEPSGTAASIQVRCDGRPTDCHVWRGRRSSWMTDQVLQDVFFPRYENADRFDHLTKLCLQTERPRTDDADRRRAEAAAERAFQERTTVEQQMEALRRRRCRLEAQQQALIEHTGPSPARIHQIQAQIETVRQRQSEVRRHIIRLTEETHSLQETLRTLSARRAVKLDRRRLQQELAELQSRRDQWTRIQVMVEHLTDPMTSTDLPAPERSGRAVRAVIERLENVLAGRTEEAAGLSEHGIDQEVAVLCRFAQEQNDSVQAWQQTCEQQCGRQALNGIVHARMLLDARIRAVQEELQRADNLLDRSLHENPACRAVWHQSYRAEQNMAETAAESLRQRLADTRAQLTARQTEQTTLQKQQRHLTARLEDLRRKLQAVPSLEQIDEFQAQLAEIDAELERLAERRRVLTTTEEGLRETAVRLQEQPHPENPVLEIASRWLQQITQGECLRVAACRDARQLVVDTSVADTPLQICQLSRGTQHQLGLVLRLALACVHAEHGRFPMVIDDVFLTSDDERGQATADLLRDVAAGGQQILLLTCQNDVCDLLASRGAGRYVLQEARSAAPIKPVRQAAAPQVEVPLTIRTFDVQPDPEAEETAETSAETVESGTGTDDPPWLYYVEADAPVTELSGLALSEQRGLAAGRIVTVDDLLTCVVSETRERIQQAGFFITDERLTALRHQAELLVRIPMLRPRDAELLVVSGIQTVRQLAHLRPEAVYELVTRFQNSDSGQRYRRQGMAIDRQQAINWTRWALHARSLPQARDAVLGRASRHDRDHRLLSASRRPRAGSRAATRRHARPQKTSAEQQRLRMRRRRTSRRHAAAGASAEPSRSDGDLKFYLQRSSPVEKAPSIGPRTAERLRQVGVDTVDDLLNCDAHTVATLLDDRRIRPADVEQWKRQAALVCTVPKLRGHDAQILVACGRHTPDDICSMSAEQLYAVVQPFCETTEGARIIRGGRKPDLKEVQDWISWAGQSRSLRAA